MAKKSSDKISSNLGVSIQQDQLTDMIRKKATELYEKSGKKSDRDMDNWLEAERMIRQKI